jgi:hypothetical protein
MLGNDMLDMAAMLGNVMLGLWDEAMEFVVRDVETIGDAENKRDLSNRDRLSPFLVPKLAARWRRKRPCIGCHLSCPLQRC